ncbi:hypothetical protein BH20ACT7_BH20ACT7_12760 [soil metagenome]
MTVLRLSGGGDETELWFGPGRDSRAAYLRFAGHVERWPRSREMVACA